MNAPYALEPEHLGELAADPAPFADYLDNATDHTIFRGQIRDAIDYALGSHGLTHTGQAVPDGQVWRQAQRDELAESIALHLCAGLAPVMEAHSMRAFLGALELAKKDRAAKEPSSA